LDREKPDYAKAVTVTYYGTFKKSVFRLMMQLEVFAYLTA